jgi:uncharacterized protein (TIRG00374 family)
MLSQLLFKIVTRGKLKTLNLQIEDFLRGVEQMRQWKFLFAVVLTFLSYGLFFIRCYLIALALRISLDFFTFVFFMSMVSLVVLVPISIAGLGTREGTLIFLFSHVAIPQEVSLSFSLLILFAVNVWTGMLGFMAWLVKPLPVTGLMRNVIKGEKVRT